MYKHSWNFDSICFFPEITIMWLYINFIHSYIMLLVGPRAALNHLTWKEQIRAFDVEHANRWAHKGGLWSGVVLSEVRQQAHGGCFCQLWTRPTMALCSVRVCSTGDVHSMLQFVNGEYAKWYHQANLQNLQGILKSGSSKFLWHP